MSKCMASRPLHNAVQIRKIERCFAQPSCRSPRFVSELCSYFCNIGLCFYSNIVVTYSDLSPIPISICLSPSSIHVFTYLRRQAPAAEDRRSKAPPTPETVAPVAAGGARAPPPAPPPPPPAGDGDRAGPSAATPYQPVRIRSPNPLYSLISPRCLVPGLP